MPSAWDIIDTQPLPPREDEDPGAQPGADVWSVISSQPLPPTVPSGPPPSMGDPPPTPPAPSTDMQASPGSAAVVDDPANTYLGSSNGVPVFDSPRAMKPSSPPPPLPASMGPPPLPASPQIQLPDDSPSPAAVKSSVPVVSIYSRKPGTQQYVGPNGRTVDMPAPQEQSDFDVAKQWAEKPLISPDDVEEAFPFLVGPFAVEKALLKGGAGMTSLENTAILAGTGGLNALAEASSGLAAGSMRAASTGLSVMFGAQAGKALLDRYPQMKQRWEAGDWQRVLDMGGASLLDAAVVAGSAFHAAGEGVEAYKAASKALDAGNARAANQAKAADMQASPGSAAVVDDPAKAAVPTPAPVEPSPLDKLANLEWAPNGDDDDQQTIPESRHTLRIQMEQLAAGNRQVVMFPKGTDLLKRPKGTKAYTDADGNTFVYDPSRIDYKGIQTAIDNHNLPSILGAADGGMGAPDKSQLGTQPVAVVGRDAQGETAQGTITDQPNLRRTIDQTQKVTPPGGDVSVERPNDELAHRISEAAGGQELTRGTSDIPLTDEGAQHAEELGQKFARRGGVDKIYHGPLERTVETAQAIAEAQGDNPPLIPVEGLRPWALGDLEGQPEKDTHATVDDLMKKEPDVAPPGQGPLSEYPGESHQQFVQNLGNAIVPILEDFDRDPEQRIAVVTHSRDLRALRAMFDGGFPRTNEIDPNGLDTKVPDPGEVVHLYKVRMHPKDPGVWAMREADMSGKDPLEPGIYIARHDKTEWNAGGDTTKSGSPGEPGDLTYLQAWNRTQEIVDEWRRKDPNFVFEREFQDHDSDRGYARYLTQRFNQLPRDLQEFWLTKEARDAETGEWLNVSEHGVRGSHVRNVREAADNEFWSTDDESAAPQSVAEKPQTASPEVGPHGPIFREFEGKPAEAIAKLQQEKTGEVPRVWHNADLARTTGTDGWIDLVWGNERGGLAHIVSKHVEGQKDLTLEDLASMIPEMRVASHTERSVSLESDTHEAGVRLDFDGQRKSWLVTAYEKKPPTGGSPVVPGSPESGGHPPPGGSPVPLAPAASIRVGEAPASSGPTPPETIGAPSTNIAPARDQVNASGGPGVLGSRTAKSISNRTGSRRQAKPPQPIDLRKLPLEAAIDAVTKATPARRQQMLRTLGDRLDREFGQRDPYEQQAIVNQLLSRGLLTPEDAKQLLAGAPPPPPPGVKPPKLR